MTTQQKIVVGVLAGLAVMAGLFIYVTVFSQPQMTAAAASEKLIGDWVRPDGGYVIRISSINSDRTVQTAYFNPNPINVQKANVSFKNGDVKLFVELRDLGYPGSKYDLVYKAENDVLQGTYFQARDGELYNVVFVRKK